MSLLEGKTILITGASCGIGLAVAKGVHEQGGRVIGVARNGERLASALGEIGSDRIRAIPFDVTSFSEYASFVREIAAIEGPGEIDGIVHAAGSASLLPVRNIIKDDLDRIMSVHLYAPILLTTELLKTKKLRSQGSVVFISSQAAVQPAKTQMPYAIAKSGLLMAARCMTSELTKRYQIRFNSVLPGTVDTPGISEITRMTGADQVEKILGDAPLGIGQASDVSSMVNFLLSDQSRWISGTSFLVDGGAVCNAR